MTASVLTARAHQRSAPAHSLGFWVAALAFLLNMAFSAVPTPLYALYAERDGFTALTITIIYAAYAIGVVGSLFLGGHISDWYGRKAVFVPALLINVASAAIFILAPSLTGLIIARIISGISIGLTTATATAYLAELQLGSRTATGKRAGVVAAAANLGGIGLGPLIAGLLAQHAPDPLRLPYVVVGGMIAVLALLVALSPETKVVPRALRPRYRPQRVAVPAATRDVFFAATGVGIAINAIMGIFTSLVPSFLITVMNESSRAVAGAVVFAAFGSAALAPILLARWDTRTMLRHSLVVLTLGLGLFVAGVFLANVPVFLIGGIVTGAGAGLAFRAALGTVAMSAPPEARAETLAGFFLGGYIGLSVPVVGLGLAADHLPTQWAMLGFVVLALTCAIAFARRVLKPR